MTGTLGDPYNSEMNNPIRECAIITVETLDGVLLDGAWYPSPETDQGALLIHGRAQNFYSSVVGWLTPHLADLGFSALSLNMRDHDHAEIDGITNSNFDVRAGIDFLNRNGSRAILLVGISYGSNKASLFIQETSKYNVILSGLILMSVGGVKSYQPQVWADVLQSIRFLTDPLLVLQAKTDEYITNPESRGQEMLMAASRSREKRLVVIDKADHGFSRHREEVIGQINSWLKFTNVP
jgi:pimeloyl-ACP methyl ester carboxylesterase